MCRKCFSSRTQEKSTHKKSQSFPKLAKLPRNWEKWWKLMPKVHKNLQFLLGFHSFLKYRHIQLKVLFQLFLTILVYSRTGLRREWNRSPGICSLFGFKQKTLRKKRKNNDLDNPLAGCNTLQPCILTNKLYPRNWYIPQKIAKWCFGLFFFGKGANDG